MKHWTIGSHLLPFRIKTTRKKKTSQLCCVYVLSTSHSKQCSNSNTCCRKLFIPSKYRKFLFGVPVCLGQTNCCCGLRYFCSDHQSNNPHSLKNNKIRLFLYWNHINEAITDLHWKRKQVLLHKKKKKKKGICCTYVGIVALLGILVKDGIRESAYQHESITKSSWNRHGQLSSDLLCCWDKNKCKRKKICFLHTANPGCNQVLAELRGWALVYDAVHNHLQLL